MVTSFTESNHRLDALLEVMERPRDVMPKDELFCGLDIGTAFIVLVVLDEHGESVACNYEYADAVRDGMVVDYMGACAVVRRLKANLEEELGAELAKAAVAIPPGTENLGGNVVRNVAESAGFEVVATFDEPTAANYLIGAKDAAIVDIGGGTTGISVFSNGRVVKSVDESTGGVHFSLVLAGALSVSFEKAERYKRDRKNHSEVLQIVLPTVDKVAHIIEKAIRGYEVPGVILVGGTAELSGIGRRVEQKLGIPVHLPKHPMFVTPLGIALGCRERAAGDGGTGDRLQTH